MFRNTNNLVRIVTFYADFNVINSKKCRKYRIITVIIKGIIICHPRLDIMVSTKQKRKTNYTMTFVLRMRCWTIHTRFLFHDYGYGAYATFRNMSLISWRSVYWWRNPSYQQNTTDLSQVTSWQTWSYNAVSSSPRHERSSNSQLKWSYALIAHVGTNITTIRPRCHLVFILCQHFSTVTDWVYS